MALLSVGQHLSLWPAIKTLSPDREKLYWELTSNSVMNRFRSLDFRDFLEKHLHFFIRYLMDISKYSQKATRQYQTLFYRKSSHTVIYIGLCGKMK